MSRQASMIRQGWEDEGLAQERVLAACRDASARWILRERTRARLASGVPELDAALGGGWPQGRVSELIGSASSGRTSIAIAAVAAASWRGEVVAWIDAADAFDPSSARDAGVELAHVLWVRPAGVAEAVRVAELVLDAGGFSVVVLDLVATRSGRGAGRKDVLRLRLARAAERAGAVMLVLTRHPWVGTLAGATVVLGRGTAVWGGMGRAVRWLGGLVVSARVERGAAAGRERLVTLRLAGAIKELEGAQVDEATKQRCDSCFGNLRTFEPWNARSCHGA